MTGLLGQRLLTRFGAPLAMLAFALHLALSFAHMHPPQPGPELAHQAESGAPAAPQPAPSADDNCAICANLSAFASLTLPNPVAVGLPATPLPFAFPWLRRTLPRLSAYHLYLGRAPPAV